MGLDTLRKNSFWNYYFEISDESENVKALILSKCFEFFSSCLYLWDFYLHESQAIVCTSNWKKCGEK